MTHDLDPVRTILTWLRAAHPALIPASPEETETQLRALEQDLGVALPADLRHYFQMLGPYLTAQEHGLFYGMTALPLSAALQERATFSSPGSAFLNPECPAAEAADPPGTVRLVGFDAGWLPVAHDHSGAYLAVDLHPAAGGQVGQIINFGTRERTRFVLASSITEFFAHLLGHLAAGRVEVDCEAGIVEVRFTDPEITHPLDLCEQGGASALRCAEVTPFTDV